MGYLMVFPALIPLPLSCGQPPYSSTQVGGKKRAQGEVVSLPDHPDLVSPCCSDESPHANKLEEKGLILAQNFRF